jgi:hypothetical protein
MVQSKVKSMPKSKVKVTLRPTAIQSVRSVPSPLCIKGFHSKNFNSTSGGIH